MRPQFRIWDNEEQRYYSPTYMAWAGELNELVLNPSGRLGRRTMQGMFDESNFEGRYETELASGKRDSNDVMIFEGDYIRVSFDNRSDIPDAVYKIVWINTALVAELHDGDRNVNAIRLHNVWWDERYATVIGNVREGMK